MAGSRVQSLKVDRERVGPAELARFIDRMRSVRDAEARLVRLMEDADPGDAVRSDSVPRLGDGASMNEAPNPRRGGAADGDFARTS